MSISLKKTVTLLLFWVCSISFAQAQTAYNLSQGSYPPCSTNWQVSGTTYTCSDNGRVTLPAGSTVMADSDALIVANNGFSLENTIVGSEEQRINLRSQYGAVNSSGPTEVYGDISAESSNITLNNTDVYGGIETGGNINLSGGTVTERVVSRNNTIRSNNSDLLGGARAQSGMSITGGTLSGDFTMTSLNPASFEGVTLTSGSITGAGSVRLTDSTVGSSANPVEITTGGDGHIVVDNTRVYGDVRAPSYREITVINGGSIIGTCFPNEDACSEDTGPEVAFYSLQLSGVGVTCEAEPVVVTAHDEQGNAIVPEAGTQVVMSAAPNTGATSWAEGDVYTFGGSESNFMKSLQQTQPLQLDIVADGGTAVSPVASIEFFDAGLRFYGDSGNSAIPSQFAGRTDTNVVLRAVRTDNTGACVSRLANETRSVGLGFECINPGSCIDGQVLTLAGSGVAANDSGVGPDLTPIALDFDNRGFASIPISYSDVGSIRLYGALALQAEGQDPAIILVGASNNFVVKPDHLEVTSVTDQSGSRKPEGDGTDEAFVAAGEEFSVVVEARNAAGNATPNFGNEDISQGVRVELETLVYPQGGTLGALGNADEFTFLGQGRAGNDTLFWNEVGAFTLSARLVGDDYLGAGDLAELVESPPVGRFHPYDFEAIDSYSAEACGGFSYLDQDAIELAVILAARNRSGGVVTNYDNSALGYQQTAVPASSGHVAENANSGDGGVFFNGQSVERVEAVFEGGWSGGIGTFDATDAVVLRANNSNNILPGGIDGPWSDLQIGLTGVEDPDGRSLAEGFNMNPNTIGNCDEVGDCNAVALGEALDLRFGRLQLNDAYGSEVVDLPVRFFTEYWNGTEFVRNVGDSCTLIPRGAIIYPDGNLGDDANRTVVVGAGTTTGGYGNLDDEGVKFLASDADHYFSRPGQGNTGTFQVQIDLTALPWLRYDWNQDGSFNDSMMPPARFGFGSYRGHDRIIYWREVLE